MSRRSLTVLALAAVSGIAAFCVPTMSGATFTSVSTNAISSVTASADWTPPTVSVRQPAAVVSNTVTITADAADAQTGVATVALQVLANGSSTWTTLCTATTSPYSCSFNTRNVADGAASLRAIATDNAGYSTTSDTVSTTVANNLSIVMSDPGDVVKNTVALSATLYNSLVPYNVSIQYTVAGTTSWTTLCSGLVLTTLNCSWDTTAKAFTSGESYDFRAVATLLGNTVTSTTVADVLVDNTKPTVTMTDPGTPLRGTVTFAATAADAESGLANVVIQYQRLGASTWTDLCTMTLDPYSCRYDTTKLTDGSYSFRAVANDNIANQTVSTVIAARIVDNTVSSVSMEDPGAFLAGTTTLTATASSTAGVTSVRIDRAPSGTTTWTTVCTDTSSPYACSFDTTTVADGLYDFRAVMIDGAGRTTTSATMSARRVDNSPLKGYDVQTISGGATTGRLDNGDQIKLTYADQVNLSTIISGWTGTSTTVRVRLRDGLIAGTGSGSNTSDVLDVIPTGTTTALPLGSVNLKQNYIKNNKTAIFTATMVATTASVNGITSTVITLTVGALSSGGSLRTVSGTSTMVWTPSATALDLNGRPCSTAPTAERGTLDREF